MRLLLRLAAASAWNRRLTLALTIVALSLSVALLVCVERIRHDARAGFVHSISGTDLVVGARGSPVQLMLFAVFRIGDAPDGLRWESYRTLAEMPEVAWTIPLSLGDSHRGFPVVGTTVDYFRHFRYGRSQALELAHGRPFEDLFEAVIGAEIAERLRYRVGDSVVLHHGLGEMEHGEHEDKPFRVVGILERTGTPVDRSLHIDVRSMEAIHLEWHGGAPMPGLSIPAEYARKFDLRPERISAALVGLKQRTAVFGVQRRIGRSPAEPLMAVLPGVALGELWRIVGTVENMLLGLSLLVVAVGLCGMVAVLLASLNERRRELAIYRSVGAGPAYIFGLLMLESGLVAGCAALLGYAAALALLQAAAPYLQAQFALLVEPLRVAAGDLRLLLYLALGGTAAGMLPGLRAYLMSLSDGLSPRL